ncbi:MAG: GNAT family N-acetyltransferase [Acidobacteriota bacterium]|nr:MAG: GNAT family N-acetyltransferase [Acidobacteriota bacterium]
MSERTYQIRLGREPDLTILNDIENAASGIFQYTKYALEVEQEPLSIDQLREQSEKDLVWVAVDETDHPVGFAVVLIIENHAHLHELSVHPEHGRNG